MNTLIEYQRFVCGSFNVFISLCCSVRCSVRCSVCYSVWCSVLLKSTPKMDLRFIQCIHQCMLVCVAVCVAGYVAVCVAVCVAVVYSEDVFEIFKMYSPWLPTPRTAHTVSHIYIYIHEMCCRMLRSVAECWRVLQNISECCRVLQRVVECCKLLQWCRASLPSSILGCTWSLHRVPITSGRELQHRTPPLRTGELF